MPDNPHHDADSPAGEHPPAGGHPSGTAPGHVPTKKEILEALKKQGVSDLEALAAKIHEEAKLAEASDEPTTESTFIFDGDAYVYKHVSIPTTVACW
jgi:hypothetical protein